MAQAVSTTERDGTITRPDGRTLRYAEYGVPDGEPALFLHGTPGSRLLGSVFDEQASRAGVRLLAPDRPGFGASTPDPDRTPSDTAADLAALLEASGVERARVVGFSGGAVYALALAATHPRRVRRVDLLSGAVPPSLQSATPRVQALLGTLACRTPRLLAGLLRLQRAVVSRGAPSLVVDQYTSDGAGTIPDAVVETVGRDFLEALADSRSGTVVESRHAARAWPFDLDVEPPVHLRHGARDTNVPVDGARRLADRLPDARLTVFEDADHLGTLLRSRAELFGDR